MTPLGRLLGWLRRPPALRLRFRRPPGISRGGGWVVAGLILALMTVWAFSGGLRPPRWDATGRAARPGEYLFCTWNVENLFDDRDDPANPDAEETWFGRNPAAVSEKVGLLADALLAQNGGAGPDVLVMVEVESRRAADLVRVALNDRLPARSRYEGLVFRGNRSGRRIAPAVITRLPVRPDLTRDYPPQRILEAHLEGPGGAPLVVLASHWTSRLSDRTGAKRAAYADTLSKLVAGLRRDDPAADVIVAGDFNDQPGDPSVRDHLNAVADPAAVVAAGGESAGTPLLLDLAARLDPAREGTYDYRGRWEVLDHVVVSPGLLDGRGWTVLPDTFRVENGRAFRYGRDGRPWKFGGPKNPNPRGPSDHFAVTVRLTARP